MEYGLLLVGTVFLVTGLGEVLQLFERALERVGSNRVNQDVDHHGDAQSQLQAKAAALTLTRAEQVVDLIGLQSKLLWIDRSHILHVPAKSA